MTRPLRRMPKQAGTVGAHVNAGAVADVSRLAVRDGEGTPVPGEFPPRHGQPSLVNQPGWRGFRPRLAGRA
jgi:hypothetical protein